MRTRHRNARDRFPLLAFTTAATSPPRSAPPAARRARRGRALPEQLAVDLKWIREHAGGKPFGVDLLIPRKYAGSNESGLGVEDLRGMIPDEHRKWIDDLLERYGVPSHAADEGELTRSGRTMAVDPKSMAPLIDVAYEHGISLFALALGSPPEWLIERSRKEGVPVAALAGRLDHAIAHRDAGVDLIIAQGTGAAATPARSRPWCWCRRSWTRSRRSPCSPRAASRAGARSRRRWRSAPGRVVRIGVAHHARGRDRASVKGEVPRRVVERHRRSRSFHRQAGAHAAHAVERRLGRRRGADPLPMPLQSMLVADAQRRIHRVVAHQAGSGGNQLVTYFVGQVVGQMNVRETDACGRDGDDRGVHRHDGAPRGADRGGVAVPLMPRLVLVRRGPVGRSAAPGSPVRRALLAKPAHACGTRCSPPTARASRHGPRVRARPLTPGALTRWGGRSVASSRVGSGRRILPLR